MSGVAQFLYPKFSMQWGFFFEGGKGGETLSAELKNYLLG